jgi:hypothetical protein
MLCFNLLEDIEELGGDGIEHNDSRPLFSMNIRVTSFCMLWWNSSILHPNFASPQFLRTSVPYIRTI